MAAEKYLYGIKSIKFGTPTGTSAMPAASNMTQFAQTVQGSLTISEDESTLTEFFVEETSTPVHSIVSQPGALRATWRAYDMSVDHLKKVKGGTATKPAAPADHTYDGPITIEALELALEITTNNDVTFEIYKSAVIARFDSTLGRENLLELEVQATALDPGDGGSPYKISLPNPS
jgi:hypothetical protein